MCRILLIVVALSALASACSSSGDDAAAPSTSTASSTTTTSTTTSVAPAASTTTEPAPTTTLPEPEALTILVTNDDGVFAPGMDTLVSALDGLAAVDLVVVAPAENASATSDTTTDGEVTFEPASTASGFAATAVDGFPADAVLVALEALGLEPDLVVSGVNAGQNFGPFASLSGTVGAARTAARNGVPAIALSAGIDDPTGAAVAASLAVDWIDLNRDAIERGLLPLDTVVSFNVPKCVAGSIGALVPTELAAEFVDGVPLESDCTVDVDEPPTDDVGAIAVGFATQTNVPVDF